MSKPRYPYRAVQEIEDAIAHQLALDAELRRSRKNARTPTDWAYLDAQVRHAEAVLVWLVTLRTEMHPRPGERSAPEDRDAT
jgi:hypothetical protein